MPAVRLSPVFNDAQLDSAGNPFVGAKLFTYVAGSVNTKLTTFTAADGVTAQTNPIILNARGEPTTGQIWLEATRSYKFVLAPPTDTDPPVSPIRTIDNITGVNDVVGTVNEWISFAGTPTFVSSSSFTLVGDQTTVFHAGRRLKCTVTAGTVFNQIAKSSFAAGLTTVTVFTANLDSGLSVVTFGINSAVNPSDPLNGEAIVALFAAPSTPLAAFENLVGTRPSVSTVTDTADRIVLTNATGQKVALSSVSVTSNITTSGANGLDTGSEAASTWYFRWVIWNGTTVSGLLSLSSTAPTLPTGYTHKGLCGAVRNNASSNFNDFEQRGPRIPVVGGVVLLDGSATILTSVSLAAEIPPNAFEVMLQLTQGGINTSSGFATISLDSAGDFQLQPLGDWNNAEPTGRSYIHVPLRTSQTIWYSVSNSNMDLTINVKGYRW